MFSTHAVIRRLGVAEEYHRLARVAVDYARLSRDREIAACESAGNAPRAIAAAAGVSRRRVEQVLRDERERASRRPAAITRLRAPNTDERSALLGGLAATAEELAKLQEREARARAARHEEFQAAREAGFSLKAIADLVGLSKPRVEQICADGEVRIGPLTVS